MEKHIHCDNCGCPIIVKFYEWNYKYKRFCEDCEKKDERKRKADIDKYNRYVKPPKTNHWHPQDGNYDD